MLQRTYDLIGTLERAHPESGKPHTIHGDFLMRDNRFTEAREQFQLALEYEKDRFPIWQQLLQLDLQLQDNEAVGGRGPGHRALPHPAHLYSLPRHRPVPAGPARRSRGDS